MSLDELIQAVAEELGIPDLQLNDAGVCQVVVDGNLEVNIEDAPLEQSVHIYSTVAHVPDTAREEFFALLLEAQLFGRETGEGCAFGYERASSEILLCRRLTLAGLEPGAFAAALSEFMSWAEHWKEKLANVDLDTGRASFSTESPSMEHFIRA